MPINNNFIEWYKLNLSIRADLVPVLENVRSGTNIELWKFKQRRNESYFRAQKKYLKYCLKRLGLYCKEHREDYYVSKNSALLNRLWSREIMTGEFLGYPKCCINSFEQGCQEALTSGLEKGPAVQFYRKVKNATEKGNFNQVLFYALHIPCGLDCEETITMAEKIKVVLESKDIEAAYYFREYNINRFYEYYYRYATNSLK